VTTAGRRARAGRGRRRGIAHDRTGDADQLECHVGIDPGNAGVLNEGPAEFLGQPDTSDVASWFSLGVDDLDLDASALEGRHRNNDGVVETPLAAPASALHLRDATT
jgi:hypothetical protein